MIKLILIAGELGYAHDFNFVYCQSITLNLIRSIGQSNFKFGAIMGWSLLGDNVQKVLAGAPNDE